MLCWLDGGLCRKVLALFDAFWCFLGLLFVHFERFKTGGIFFALCFAFAQLEHNSCQKYYSKDLKSFVLLFPSLRCMFNRFLIVEAFF